MKCQPQIRLLCFLFLGLLFFSCQKEEVQMIDETTEETISRTSPLVDLILRSSENSGSFDDIIDGNSCASVVLPVTVFANGQKVIINTEEDYQLVQAIFDQFPYDDDTLEILFPITIIFEDFTQVVVNSQEELDSIIAACKGDLNDAIECVDFVYPITFFIYDIDQQQGGTQTVNSDFELFQFLNNLNEDQYISIDFPISVIVNGETIQVNTNQELFDIISNVTCENGTGDPIDTTQFTEDLTTGVWYITYYFDDNDQTSDFTGYEFDFAIDNTATATSTGNTINGTWSVSGGTTPELDLFFGTTNPFDELDEDWDIIEATSEIIRLKDISGSDGSTDYLTFERTPNDDGSNNDINNLIEQLTTGVWYVNLYNDDGTDETCDYVDYNFTFNTNGTAVAMSAADTRNGFWTVEAGNNNIDLILNFENSGGGDPFEDLNDDWDVVGFDATFINLMDESGGSGGTDLLNFERNPYTGCGGGGGGGPDPQELKDIMVMGTWYISSYLDDGNDETGDYAGYNFNFYSNETVQATNGINYVSGIWIVTVVGDELNFEFDMDSPINGADDDDYKVLQFTDTKVTLITKDSNGNIEDTLIFEKN